MGGKGRDLYVINYIFIPNSSGAPSIWIADLISGRGGDEKIEKGMMDGMFWRDIRKKIQNRPYIVH